nr:immunoglobulin heavy chain junction region [Macaca mulatta]MOX05471.1 immunoglobulin heavy chain junction region [Macaca mulatta]MOX05489.1 immunoglobulin heavy chain junction region [Macaca mulatta]
CTREVGEKFDHW